MKFGQRAHMEAFRSRGMLHLNSQAYFARIENDAARRDPFEGTDHIHQPSAITRITIAGPDGAGGQREIVIPSDQLAGPVSVAFSDRHSYNLFCMFGIQQPLEPPFVDERCLDFGDSFVLVLNTQAFLDRLDATIRAAGLAYAYQFVEHFDDVAYSGETGVFRKPASFAYQREFRIAVWPGADEPLQLYLGDLSDITTPVLPLAEINQLIDFCETSAREAGLIESASEGATIAAANAPPMLSESLAAPTDTPAARRKPEITEDLQKFTTFAGTLSCGGVSVPIRFRLRFGVDGELYFRVYEMPRTKQVAALQRMWLEDRAETVVLFTVTGTSKAGTSFKSDYISATKFSTRLAKGKTYAVLKPECTEAVLIQPFDGHGRPPVIRWALRGFSCFRELHSQTPLGEVVVRAAYPRPKTDRTSGFFHVTAHEPPEDFSAWRRDVEKLFDEVREFLGFAQAHHVKAPVQSVWANDTLEVVAISQTKPKRNGQPPFHPMGMQAFFEAAVAYCLSSDRKVEDLSYALEWFAMEATYSETHLMNPMTALEHLTDANLAAADKLLLPPKLFNKVAQAMRQAARVQLASSSDGDAEKVTREFLAVLAGKMQDLNRRPLNDKIVMLAERVGVPLEGLPMDGLPAAISARNTIVHRGFYHDPASSTEPPDIWDHVLLIRELLVRFVLTVIGYEGIYLSYRGGQHDVRFPPLAPEVTEPSS